ncbi:hypothetical protein HDV04_002042 [Boothiomyces sp. JEL0838]|nr:hypothetical protein HDV04_002042 [Boothiomyces sp. JEL0838]
MAKAPQKKKNTAVHLAAGGIAGCCEALACHPLDTIKVRLQLAKAQAKRGFIGTGIAIVQKEGFLSLYKGLGAVTAGIVPKMAIRFSSLEFYKDQLRDKQTGYLSSAGVFLAGLGAGTTESIMVVTPMDVIKIRLQAQRNSMTDPLDIPKYRNAFHCAYVMVKEEGVGSLYKGLGLTVIRQGTNQAANFTVYEFLKSKFSEMQPTAQSLPSYQTAFIGLISGACGPLFNAPVDTIKTRIQKNPSTENGLIRVVKISKNILQTEGFFAFYKGLVPRVLRVAPGQSITFMVYEKVYKALSDLNNPITADMTA